MSDDKLWSRFPGHAHHIGTPTWHPSHQPGPMSIGKMLGKPLWEWGPLNDQPHSTPYIMDIYWDHIPVLKF